MSSFCSLLDEERKQLGLARKKRSLQDGFQDGLELDQYNRHSTVSSLKKERGIFHEVLVKLFCNVTK